MQPNKNDHNNQKGQNYGQAPGHQWPPYPYPYPYYPQYGAYPMPHPSQFNPNYPNPAYHHPQYPNQMPYPHPPPPQQPSRQQQYQELQKYPQNKQPVSLNREQKHKKEVEKPPAQRNNKKQQKNRHRNQKDHSSDSGSGSQEDEDQLYYKTKTIAKKRDSVMDSPAQIKKWVEARKKNYPGAKQQQNADKQAMQAEISILEKKIRKKIMLVSSDGRGIFKKMKNMDILRRLISENKIDKIGYKGNKNGNKGGPALSIAQRVIRRIRNEQIKEKQDREEQQRILKESVQKIKNNQSIDEKSQEGELDPAMEIQESQNSSIVQQPIQKQTAQQISEPPVLDHTKLQSPMKLPEVNNPKAGYNPEEMIKHLKQRQEQDRQFYGQLLNYKSNSLNYKYNSQTLDVNFVLEDIFQESSYLLQAIRYIVKNNFFDAKEGQNNE